MIHFFLILLLISFNITSSEPQADEIRQVVFNSYTRGYQETITITPDAILVEKTGGDAPGTVKRALTKPQWQMVVESLRQVQLTEISKLESPTHQRERDAALHSKFIISTPSQTYTSSTFDGHHPPKPLMPLMKVIESITKEE